MYAHREHSIAYWGYQKYKYLFEQQQQQKKTPVLGDKRQKSTQASKANILKYKVRK